MTGLTFTFTPELPEPAPFGLGSETTLGPKDFGWLIFGGGATTFGATALGGLPQVAVARGLKLSVPEALLELDVRGLKVQKP